MEYRMNGINFLISLAWAEGGIDVGDLMLEIEKCSEVVLKVLYVADFSLIYLDFI